jgi:hypothetical protein
MANRVNLSSNLDENPSLLMSECMRNDHHMSSFVYACFHNQFNCFKVLFEHALEKTGDSDRDKLLNEHIGDQDV